MVDQAEHPRSAAQLLADYRDAVGPSGGTEARMLASLHAQLIPLALDPSPLTSGAASSSASSASVGGAAVVKIALALSLVVGGVAAAGTWIDADSSMRERIATDERGRDPAPEPSATPELAEDQLPPIPRVTPTPTPTPTPTRVESEQQEPRAHAKPRRRAVNRHANAKASAGPALADEAKLLRSADAALRRGDLEQAHALLDDYTQSFAAGSLATHAQRLELLLACSEGGAVAKQAAARYLEEHPDTRGAARIQTTCDLP